MSELYYLDSSVALWAIHNNDADTKLRTFFQDRKNVFISSALLRTEVIRTLRRDELSLELADFILHNVRLISITPETLKIAESIEQHIKTLDAIHLAEAMKCLDAITLLTHDKQMKRVAKANNISVYDPIES